MLLFFDGGGAPTIVFTLSIVDFAMFYLFIFSFKLNYLTTKFVTNKAIFPNGFYQLDSFIRWK